MKEANSKAFESVDEKINQLKDDMKSQSSKINTNLERSFDEKFSSTSLSISSLNKMIQTVEGKIEAASDVIFLVSPKLEKIENLLEGNNKTLDKLENNFQTLSLEMNSGITDLNDKLSTLETSLINGNNAVIQEVSKNDNLEKLQETQNKSFENVYEKFDLLKDDIKSQSSRISTNLEKSFNEKFSSTSHNISSLDNMIQTIEAKVDASSDAISLGKASKKSDFYHFWV